MTFATFILYSHYEGGSLKKYNGADYRWALFGIILPMIVFLLSLNIVYALFTASSTPISSSQTTAIVRIGFSNDTALNNVAVSSTSSNITNLVPGDDLTLTGKVVNSGNSAIYFLLNLKLEIRKTTSNANTTILNKVYTISSNNIVEYNSTNNAAAASNTPNEEFAFSFTHTLSTDYGNEYQLAEITYTLTAYAVQQYNLTAVTAATYINSQLMA